MYTVERLTSLGVHDDSDIYGLVHRITGYQFLPIEYIDYLRTYQDQIGLFVIRQDHNIVGFIQAEAPHPLDKQVGWIVAVVMLPGVPKALAQKTLEFTEEWLASQGASRWQARTRRNYRAWMRRWSLKIYGVVNGEYIVGKTI